MKGAVVIIIRSINKKNPERNIQTTRRRRRRKRGRGRRKKRRKD